MKILYLNIFQGCPDKTRLNRIIKFVNTQSPDVLGLSELDNWQENNFERLKYFISRTKFTHYIFAPSQANHNIALFSNLPLVSAQAFDKPFRSGMIKAEVQTRKNSIITVVLTHLAAKDESRRLREHKIILSKVKKVENIIIMGDMNSLSPYDDYNQKKLLKRAKQIGLKKFGVKKLRFDVIANMLKFNLIDVVKLFTDKFVYSVPTPYNKDKAHFANLRLDYIFASKQLLPYIRNSQVVRNKVTDQLSDHYPVILELKGL